MRKLVGVERKHLGSVEHKLVFLDISGMTVLALVRMIKISGISL